MLSRFQTGLQLTQQSFTILKQKKSLIIFPLISTLMLFFIFIFAFTPVVKVEEIAWKTNVVSTKMLVIVFIILLIYFSIMHTLTLFCHGALTACALKHIKGEPYTIADGFKTASKRFRKLYRWKLVMSTIGPVILFLQNWSDKWVQSTMAKNIFADLPWITGTFLVLPVIIVENLTAFAAIKRSAHLIKNRWGSSVMSRYGIGALWFLFFFIALIPVLIAVFIGTQSAIMIGSTITTVLFLIISIVNSAVFIILSSALYLYATDQNVSLFYDTKLLEHAFRPLKTVRNDSD